MTLSKDIGGAGVPFAAGVAAAAFLPYSSIYLSASFSLAATVAGMLLLRKHRNLAFMVLMFAAAGSLCALTGRLVPGPGLSGLFAKAGEALRNTVDSIPYPGEGTTALVKALTTGDRSALSRDTIEVFRKSGASHLLALSGMHLGIIYLILRCLFKPLGNSPLSKKMVSLLTVTLCGIYAMATGASPSIVRAFLFILLLETARLTHRKAAPMKIWCGALTIQLAFSPSEISSAGFQLSYLAMAGIFILFPVLRDWYPSDGMDRLNLPRRIWEGASLAISCQAFTAPLSYFIFGSFPRYFLLTNLLAMPVTTLLMVLSVATVGLSAIGLCPHILITANDYVCRLLVDILSIVSSI